VLWAYVLSVFCFEVMHPADHITNGGGPPSVMVHCPVFIHTMPPGMQLS